MLGGNLLFVLLDLIRALWLLSLKYTRIINRRLHHKDYQRPRTPQQADSEGTLLSNRRLDPSNLDSLRSVLTVDQMDMISYYSRYNLEMPEQYVQMASKASLEDKSSQLNRTQDYCDISMEIGNEDSC